MNLPEGFGKPVAVNHIIVKEKATGGPVALENMRFFDSRYHALYTKAEIEQRAKIVDCESEVVSEENALEEPTNDAAGSGDAAGVSGSKERFLELKGKKAWAIPELKEEYYALKKIYG